MTEIEIDAVEGGSLFKVKVGCERRCCSNYFQIKNWDAFKVWCADRNLDAAQHDSGDNFVAITSDYGYWPDSTFDAHDIEFRDIEFEKELAGHLKDGSIAILMQSKCCDIEGISGTALAIDATGKSVSITMDDIYNMAANALRGQFTFVNGAGG